MKDRKGPIVDRNTWPNDTHRVEDGEVTRDGISVPQGKEPKRIVHGVDLHKVEQARREAEQAALYVCSAADLGID